MSAHTNVIIHAGRMHWSGRPNDVGPETVNQRSPFRDLVVLITVCLYLLFNWGFQQVRIPPVAGGGLPVGEFVLLLYLLTVNYTGVLGRISQTIPLIPLAIWWTFGVGRALFDFSQHGVWALRDAAHVLESLFLLVGFVFAGNQNSLDRFFRWLPKLLGIVVVYGLFYRLQPAQWSPTITSGAGYDAPIFGAMANTAIFMIVAAIHLVVFLGNRWTANLAAVLIIGYVFAIFQARTLYLVFIAIFGFLALYRRSSLGNLALMVGLFGAILAFFALLDLKIEGRLGAGFDARFLIAHLLAIIGICDPTIPGNLCAAADGVGQRLDWWAKIFQRMADDPVSLLFGLGYGIPLTEFHSNTGTIVREPHNSFISVIARTGIVGAICWVLLMVSLVRRWHKTFVKCHNRGWRTGENRLLVLMAFFISCWVLALGEDGFEKPYNIIPFYFFWGVVLRFSLLLDRGEFAEQLAQENTARLAASGFRFEARVGLTRMNDDGYRA